MTTQALIDDFLAQQTLAVVGVSRRGGKYGNMAFRDLTEKGYQVYIVHPSGDVIEGVRTYPSVKDLPPEVSGLVLVISPDQTEVVVQEAHAMGIQRIWMQPGAQSQAAIRYCEENGMSVIHRECVMMHARQVKFTR